MLLEDKVVELINKYAGEVEESAVEEEINADEVMFDVTASGMAMNFDGIEEEKLEEYFAYNFGYYGTGFIFKTENGYYIKIGE